MGYKNKKFKKSLHQQMYDTLVSKQAFCERRSEAKKTGADREKIFSFKTFQVYKEHCQYFIDYIKKIHPDCRTLKKARQYVPEWLQYQTDRGLSAWTISTEAAAVGKLFDIHPGDPDWYTPPKRRRADIKRSRVKTSKDRHFSKTNNSELIKFLCGTGLRREEAGKIQGKDLLTYAQVKNEVEALTAIEKKRRLTSAERTRLRICKDALLCDKTEYFINVHGGKGGRPRIAAVTGPDVEDIVERFKKTAPGDKVWQHIHAACDVHSYRATYCKALYLQYVRPLSDLPYDRIHPGTGHRYQSDVYHCRGDEKGRCYDRAAMLICSRFMGHNRVSVIASNYLWGL